MKKISTFIFTLTFILILFIILIHKKTPIKPQQTQSIQSQSPTSITKLPIQPAPSGSMLPLAISVMRQKSYMGSTITIEQTLTPGSSFNRYVVSYQSDNLKEYALLSIPLGQPPKNGWPVILLNHGYIPPNQYSTIDSYTNIVNAFAVSGYVVFKPDYRGNGNSQGYPTQIYISPDYVTDSLNALASIKKYPGINPQKIGVYGHSMGGNITLHELVITHDFKAAVLWSGVVGNYTDILYWWNQRVANNSIIGNDLETAQIIKQFTSDHGTPQTNPSFWNSIDPTSYLSDITTPVQIQVGTSDTTVPPQFSQSLNISLQKNNKTVNYIEYPGADHNLSPDSAQAAQDTIHFFDKYLK